MLLLSVLSMTDDRDATVTALGTLKGVRMVATLMMWT